MSPTRQPAILLIDDDAHFRKTMSDFLTFEGFDTAAAESGEAALKLLEGMHPDLIILDIAMPGMGGIGFLRRILSASNTPTYPVLVLTARSAMQDFFDAVDVHGFLPKPCRQDDLLHHVRRILAKCGHGPGGAASAVTVLVGESDRHFMAALTRALREAGYVVEVAETGPAVLEKAVAIRPHAILLQHMLPRLTGESVCGLLREIPATAGIPIVLYRDAQANRSEPRRRCALPEVLERCVFSQDVSGLLADVRELLGPARGGAAQAPATA